MNDRIFVNNVSLGVYAEIVQSDAYRDDKLKTVEKMLPELLGPRATPFDLRFVGADGTEQRSAQLLLVSNNPYVLDRLAGAGSRPRLDSGRLGVVAIQIRGALQAAELVSLDALGQIRRFEGWSRVDARTLRGRLRLRCGGGDRRRGGHPRAAAAVHDRTVGAARPSAADGSRALARGARAGDQQVGGPGALAHRGDAELSGGLRSRHRLRPPRRDSSALGAPAASRSRARARARGRAAARS